METYGPCVRSSITRQNWPFSASKSQSARRLFGSRTKPRHDTEGLEESLQHEAAIHVQFRIIGQKLEAQDAAECTLTVGNRADPRATLRNSTRLFGHDL